MVVDDDPLARLSVRRWFEMLGEAEIVAEASNGRDAVALAGRVEVDVIIMDERMPGISGVEAGRQLRALGIRTPVVFLSADETVPSRIGDIDRVSFVEKAAANAEVTMTAIRSAMRQRR